MPRARTACLLSAFLSTSCFAQSPTGSAQHLREAVIYSTRGDNLIHILQASDLSLISSHDIGLGAHELTVSPDGRWLIGTAYGGPGAGHQPADDRVAVFDLAKAALHRTIDLKPLSRPNDAAFLADSKHAYVTVEVPPRIVRLNVESGEHRAITLEHKANHMLALSPDAKRLYISHVMPGGLSMIDTSTDTVMSRIDVPAGAEGLAVTMDNSRVWVGCNRSDVIAIIDPAAGKVEKQVACPGFPLRLRASPDGKWVAASCPKAGEIAIYEVAAPDAARRASVRNAAHRVSPPLAPTSIFFTADSARLAVVSAGQDAEIVMVDVSSGAIGARRPADGLIADALIVAKVQLPTRPAKP